MAWKPKAAVGRSAWLRQLQREARRAWRSKPVGWLRRRAYRFIQRSKLLVAVLATVLVAVGLGIAAYMVLYGLLPPGKDPVQPKDLTQFALTIAAGTGGVVALVVAYRRQQGIEQSRFVERFGAAASQLGDTDVAVRLAGVYAMAGVADEASKLERQQCVDVLCGYLRLPYSPNLGASHQSELQRKVSGSGGEESTQKYLYRQNDKEVRQTIVRVIAAHLRRGAQTSWSRCDFDFRGAVLEDADFTFGLFRGDRTRFDRVTFSGEQTTFDGASFSGEQTTFDGASFSGDSIRFARATFSGDVASFDGASFSGDRIIFERANFSSVQTTFNDANFSGRRILFTEATFSGNVTTFIGATFSARELI